MARRLGRAGSVTFRRVSRPSRFPEVAVTRMCWSAGLKAMAVTPPKPMCQCPSFQVATWMYRAISAIGTTTAADIRAPRRSRVSHSPSIR